MPLNELENNISNLQHLIDNLSQAQSKSHQPQFQILVDDGHQHSQFMQQLYQPKPSMHQINTMDNPKERLNLFRFLQMKEGFKFQQIQREKLTSLQQQLEYDNQQKQMVMRSQDARKFVDFVKQHGYSSHNNKQGSLFSQYHQKQVRAYQNQQQLRNLQKQQVHDQKAFSVFQQNELEQFKQMTQGPQK